ncbi:putative integral membrane protein [Fusarium austroafricanum]|uniref:Putative integral membrane protein n=1 Tax=Fusarium austroafricanum TaxID=2364996 RepID=A0A8H4K870_9HYPO|nr:putative integral membrane protein [Fusarium austroafricanum]
MSAQTANSTMAAPSTLAKNDAVLRHGLKELLVLRPLRTKMMTSASILTLTELLSSYLAYGRPGYGPVVTSRVPKMAFYGGFISAPLSHFFLTTLQKMFQGRTGRGAKLLQALLMYSLVLPIQNAVYLASMAVISGANTVEQVRTVVRTKLLPMMKVTWAVSPVVTAVAENVVPPLYRPLFMSLFSLCIGTFFNTMAKKQRVAAARKAEELEKSPKDE